MNNTQDSEQSMRQQEKGENDPTLHGSTFARVEMCDDTTNHVPRSAPLSVSSLLCMEETSIDVMETPHREALHCTATVPTDGSNVETSCPILCSVPLLESTYSKSEKSKDERKLRNQDHHEATKSDLNTSKTRDAPSLLPATKLLQLNHSDAQVPLTLQLPVRALHTPLNFASNPGLPMHLPAIGAPGAIPPGSFYQMTAAIKASEVPPVFRDRPQRSGKWTREEEVYAELLIELFEKGHIDERNGCTLRSFLSRKLHCAPMRISKKYAGKGIGKMVFLSKSSFRGIADGIGSPSYHLNIQRLRQAEATFYRSCFPELNVVSHHREKRKTDPLTHYFSLVLSESANNDTTHHHDSSAVW